MSDFTTLFSGAGESAVHAPALPRAAEAARPMRLPMRPIKIGIGSGLLLAGFYAVFSEQQYVASGNAVVTAYLTAVRTPIEGSLSGLPEVAGGYVERGTALGRVDDTRYDEQHLQDLRQIASQARGGAEADAAEREELSRERAELLARAREHTDAVSARLVAQKTQAERVLASREADLAEAELELRRGRQLHEAGILSDAAFQKLESADKVAGEDVAAQKVEVATLDMEASAARRGVLSEPGTNNDVAYSRQRADEVSLRLADVQRNLAAMRSAAEQAEANLAAMTERAGMMRQAELAAPLSGMVWELNAVNGERVGVGDAVAQLVDCGGSFVLAEVPQARVAEIEQGAPVRLRLTGETVERTGRVAGISGDPQKEKEHKLAAFPLRDPREQLATVRISLDKVSDCVVGRSARVLIQSRGESAAGRLLRRYF